MPLKYVQEKWLADRNRSFKDVLADDKGMYIEMSGWSDKFQGVPATRKVYLPYATKQDEIDLMEYEELMRLKAYERATRG